MCTKKLRRWLLVTFVAVGCNAKLSVAPEPSGGNGGAQQAGGGAGAGSGGRLISDGGAGSAGAQFAGASTRGPVPDGGAPGAGGAPATQGNLGQPCISGAMVSSGSGVAVAAVTTLDHCSAGLACSAAGRCVAMPNCPQAVGPCVVAEVVPSDPSMGGASGSGGAGFAGSNVAGANSAGANSVSNVSGVTGMSADDTKLYWLEYGTRDTLGNYQGDGALMAMDLATEERTPLLSDLRGPIAFGLTTTHVFVFVDGGGLIGSSVHAQLLRFPLQGGEATVIQDGSPPLPTYTPGFVSSGDQAFWAGASDLYSLSGSSTTPRVLSSAMGGEPEVADSDTLFVAVGGSFLGVPLSGGAATPLSIEFRPIGLNGDFIYGLESADGGTLLTRAAKTSGAWQRIRALGGGTAGTIKMNSDRYFWAWQPHAGYSATSAISTASLSDSLPPTQIVGLDEDRALYWAGTATKLYWSDGKRIFSRSFMSQ